MNQTEAHILVANIIPDEALQMRWERQDPDHVESLMDALKAGETLPPIDVYTDEDGDPKATGATAPKYYIGDGWHRYYAHLGAHKKEILARVHKGGRDAALKRALGANAEHNALRRTNADKRKAVEAALEAFPKMSGVKIAELCKVTQPFASKIKRELEQGGKTVLSGKAPKLPESQLDFWDEMNADFKPIWEGLEVWKNDPRWLDERVTPEKKLEVARGALAQLKIATADMKAREKALLEQVRETKKSTATA